MSADFTSVRHDETNRCVINLIEDAESMQEIAVLSGNRRDNAESEAVIEICCVGPIERIGNCPIKAKAILIFSRLR